MTRTAATLLVGVAVSAVTGCVSTPSGPAGTPATHQQSPAPQHPPLPHLIGNGGQPEQLIEAPVHEVLEAAMPPSQRAPTPRTGPGTGPTGAKEAAEAPPVQSPPRSERPARRDAAPQPEPEPESPRHRGPHRKKAPLPALPKVPASAADVCALGKGYGGWSPKSPQARICRETYGG
ncbi:hypothetical protein ACH4SP_25230 [Streptomyces sp. NPDC021093]|uniref:hypothetical protein n=1 Tax=Streptomyces sp. NPDC021093 TaxID=3365112 RepID=UPI0037A44E6D